MYRMCEINFVSIAPSVFAMMLGAFSQPCGEEA
jgi:hypothetical protein